MAEGQSSTIFMKIMTTDHPRRRSNTRSSRYTHISQRDHLGFFSGPLQPLCIGVRRACVCSTCCRRANWAHKAFDKHFLWTLHMVNPAARALLTDRQMEVEINILPPCGVEVRGCTPMYIVLGNRSTGQICVAAMGDRLLVARLG